MDSPERFRLELVFSPGANFNPYEVVPLNKDHTLPVQPRACLHKGKHEYYSIVIWRSWSNWKLCVACQQESCKVLAYAMCHAQIKGIVQLAFAIIVA